ncbi:TetR/AcrR family transcriptional regulator [Clostridium chromiireducens]|uniref:TetR/AcrR family transcriptional regulator n=1 Tax=Clostridium chromiireducens TaxID=225345 RepID=UPI003AF6D281
MSESWHEKIKNKNREEIIQTGKELFLKYNFINVNIKDVCTVSGISRVTFYKHFKSIDELIFEVQMDIIRHMVQFIKSEDRCEASGKDRIIAMLNAWINFAKEYKNEIKFIFLFDFYYGAYDSNEELKLKYENFILEDDMSDFFTDAINKGITDRSLKSDLHPTKTGYYMFQTIMGVLQRVSYTSLPIKDEVLTFDDITESVVEMIISSIKNIEE